MLTATAILLWLFQDGGAPTRPFTIACPPCLGDPVAAGEARRREAKYEEQELLRRVNGLATALTDFSNTYSSRHVIDVKQIKAIRKALRELEKSDWLRSKTE
jgi:hypothetical protein